MNYENSLCSLTQSRAVWQSLFPLFRRDLLLIIQDGSQSSCCIPHSGLEAGKERQSPSAKTFLKGYFHSMNQNTVARKTENCDQLVFYVVSRVPRKLWLVLQWKIREKEFGRTGIGPWYLQPGMPHRFMFFLGILCSHPSECWFLKWHLPQGRS